MSIKPIDFQVMLPKTTEVSKMYNNEQHRAEIAEQQQGNNMQQSIENKINHVHSQDNASKTGIREKQEKNSSKNNEENSRKKKEDKKNNRKTEIEITQSKFIDIRL